MPWTGQTFAARHNHKLSGPAASKAAAQANAMLRAGVPEGIAIATANKHAAHGLNDVQHYANGGTVKTGSFHGKSNELGHGGRAAQLKAQGVPGGVIGAIARSKGAAPGGPNYHGHKFAKGGPVQPHLRMAPNHKQTPTPVPALAAAVPETNIHGMPIHRPMPMNMSRR